MKTTTTPAALRIGGFSLIEMMVALTIGLLIVVGMLASFSSSSASNQTNARVAEFRSNGRYATDFLRRELQHAGFLALSWTSLNQAGALSTDNSLNCGPGFVTNIAQPIWGANDTGFSPSTCIPNYDRGDILVVRRAGLQAIPSATALASDTLYVRTEYLQATVFLGPTRPASLQVPVEDYPLQTDFYYISPYTNSIAYTGLATESPQVPALYRLTLGPGPKLTPQLVASGIENMQVQYGIATPGGNTAYLDASAVAATDWSNVAAVRLWLLARSSTPEPGYMNNNTKSGTNTPYVLGDQPITVNDPFQRQVFPLVVQVRK